MSARQFLTICLPLFSFHAAGLLTASAENPLASMQAATGQVTARPSEPIPSHYLGAGSCSAAGCHGGNGTRPKFAIASRSTENYSAHSTWIQKDPHAAAYQVLLDEKSTRMIELLGQDWKPAQQEARCLACHSTYDLAPSNQPQQRLDPVRFSDGVSCEACHGAAEKWLVPHTQANWRTLSSDDRSQLGFRDMRENLVTRAQVCTSCHVGGPGRNVNHDLIAAGHPRLYFEMSAFHANLPAHWSQSEDRRMFRPVDAVAEEASLRETKLWLVGQLASSEAALKLLESRAGDVAQRDGPWPEFSEYSCYACHHDLQAPSWRQQSPGPMGQSVGRKPGSYPWGTWGFAFLETRAAAPAEPGLLDRRMDLEALRNVMSQPSPNTTEVLKLTQRLRLSVSREQIAHRRPASLRTDQARELFLQVTRSGQLAIAQDWDGAAQTYLATLALYIGTREARGDRFLLTEQGWKTDPVLRGLAQVRDGLRFPEVLPDHGHYDSPRDFNADRIQLIRAEMKRIEQLVLKPVAQ